MSDRVAAGTEAYLGKLAGVRGDLAEKRFEPGIAYDPPAADPLREPFRRRRLACARL